MPERRQHPRIEDESHVVVTVLSSPAAPELENRTFFCQTQNISAGGLMIHVGSHVPSGAVIKLRIAFSKPLRSFEMTGCVAWSGESTPGELKGFLLGIEFTDGRGNDLQAWRDIVSEKVGIDESKRV